MHVWCYSIQIATSIAAYLCILINKNNLSAVLLEILPGTSVNLLLVVDYLCQVHRLFCFQLLHNGMCYAVG